MSRWPAEQLGVGLCATGVVIAKGGRVLRRIGAPASGITDKPTGEAHSVRTPASWKEAISEVVDSVGSMGRGLCLTLAPSLLRWLVVETLPGARSLRELRELAELRFRQVHELEPTEWAVRGNWQVAGSWLSVAVPADLALAIETSRLPLRTSLTTSAERALALVGDRTLPRDYVWGEIAGGYGTLFWIRECRPVKVSKFRVDTRDPGARCLIEVSRHSPPTEVAVHWVAPRSVAHAGASSWIRHRLLADVEETVDDSDPATWAALLGGRS